MAFSNVIGYIKMYGVDMHVGKKCWQATGQVKLRVGIVLEQEMKDHWLMLKIDWKDGCVSWERITNISFEDLPTW